MTTKAYKSETLAANAKFHGSEEGFHMHPEWMMDAGSEVAITVLDGHVTEITIEPQGWTFRSKNLKGANLLGGSHTTDDWFTFHIKHFYLVNGDGTINLDIPLTSKLGLQYVKTVTVMTPKDVPCFWEDTLIKTAFEHFVRVGDIQVGDSIWTLDGPRSVIWVGRSFGPITSKNVPHLYKGVKLSPQHRVLVNERDDVTSFGLIAVKHHGQSRKVKEHTEARYYHFMLEKHSIVNANGVLCESMWPGEQVQKMELPGLSDVLSGEALAEYLQHPARPFFNKNYVAKGERK